MKAGHLACALLLAAWVVPASLGAPSAELEDPRTGQGVVLRPGPDAVTHVVFFATWCPSCVDELAGLSDLAARWNGQGYRQVIVAVRARQSAERVAGFFKDNPPPGELMFDAKGAAEDAWSVKHLPTHVLLDGAGAELARSEALDGVIERAVAVALDRGAGRR